jgi:hypothetical protein
LREEQGLEFELEFESQKLSATLRSAVKPADGDRVLDIETYGEPAS